MKAETRKAEIGNFSCRSLRFAFSVFLFFYSSFRFHNSYFDFHHAVCAVK